MEHPINNLLRISMENIKDMIDVNTITDQLIEPFTGKKRIAFNHGYSNDEDDSIMIRNNSVHGMTICALNLIGRVSGKK